MSAAKLPWGDILEASDKVIAFSPMDHMAFYVKAIALYHLGDFVKCSELLDMCEKIEKGAHIDVLRKALPKVEEKPAVVRESWFQSVGTVTITLYAKNVRKDRCKIIFDHREVSVKMVLADGSSYGKAWKLFGVIDTKASGYDLSPCKLEIVMQKGVEVNWKSLEENVGDVAVVRDNVVRDVRPIFPTSSKHGAKDWDGMNVKNKAEADEEEHNLNPLEFELKSAYAEGDDDTRRAVMKSYTESGGKALSFSWGEAKNKDYKKIE
ncbi:MAG: CS-domain-containing protein [Hyperionvirus sp.]|uniref:CS-domain-containing protein n=1 Tax=Hyperionvirus sp. TaxID=2487770 RepID=A0A3G5ADV5_9VIRU|nr:MAG: CS-domain-containing protein [Hyperionvirus sp.]